MKNGFQQTNDISFTGRKWTDRKAVGRILLMVILVSSLLTVLMGMNQVHLAPLTSRIALNEQNVYEYSRFDGAFVSIWEKKLIFAEEDGNLIKIVKINIDGRDQEPRDVTIDGDYVYALVCETQPLYNYYSAERLLKFSRRGTYLGEIFRKEYDEDDLIINNALEDIFVRDGYAYITETVDETARLYKVPVDGFSLYEETEPMTEFQLPENIQWGKFNYAEQELILNNRYGETYRCSINDGSIRYFPDEYDNARIDAENLTDITVDLLHIVYDLVYYLGILVLALALLPST